MGTYGTATGIIIVRPAYDKPGKILGLKDGELEAYFDSDGAIKWAGGKGVADATGISHTEDANNYWQVKPGATNLLEVKTAGGASYTAIYGREDDGYAIWGLSLRGTGVYGTSSTGIGFSGAADGAGGIGVVAKAALSATTALQINGGIVDGGSQRYTAMGNASADTDGLNRITADGRYAPIGSTGTSAGVLNFGERYVAAGSSYTRSMGERYI